jgi:hypothetical protein
VQINEEDFDTALESLFDTEKPENRIILDALEEAHYPISNFSLTVAFLDSLRISDCDAWAGFWNENPSVGEKAFRLKRSMLEAELGVVVNLVHAAVSNLQFGVKSRQKARCLMELAEILMLVSVTLYHEREIREAAMRAKELAFLIDDGLPEHSTRWTLVDPIEVHEETDNQCYRANTLVAEPKDEADQSENSEPWLAHGRRVLLKSDGTAVDSQFDSAAWHQARRLSISASDAGKLVKLNGGESRQRDALLRSKVLDERGAHFGSYDLGIEREPVLARWVQTNFPQFGFIHNRNLYVGASERHTATPDMVAKDVLCEIKVSNKELPQIRTKYRDQMQWQMHVTESSAVLFVVEDRDTQDIEYEWIQRDQSRIDVLVEAANLLINELDELLQGKELEASYRGSVVSSEIQELDLGDDYVEHGYFEFIETEEVDDDSEVKELDEDRVVELYFSRLNIWAISQAIGVEAKDVGRTLAIRVLGQTEPLVDEGAENFGQFWTDKDSATLEDQFLDGVSIEKIAKNLGRDKLGICFRVLDTFAPEIRRGNGHT